LALVSVPAGPEAAAFDAGRGDVQEMMTMAIARARPGQTMRRVRRMAAILLRVDRAAASVA
jgi:hypothetical protein